MVEKLDLDLAFKRTLHDLNDDTNLLNRTNFVARPLATELIDRNYKEWKRELAEEIESGYEPSEAIPFLVPKGDDLVRNGRHLTMKDRTVYNACVSALQSDIYEAVDWSQGEIDISYQLTGKHELEEWFEDSPYIFWRQFRNDSLEKLDDFQWLVEADIASYYDNIDIRTLSIDLERQGADQNVVHLLSSCLQRWSIFKGKGIPQGYNASHILAKLYLNNFDVRISDKKFEHLRYNDDIRIFCQSKSSARQVLKDVFAFLGDRGLPLQSAKTKISRKEDATKRINEVQNIIDSIEDRIHEANTIRIEGDQPYDDIFVSLPPEDIDAEAIREATQQYLLDSDEEDFSGTLFRYLINRLGKLGDDMAVEYCLSMIAERPRQTSHILRYLQRVGVNAETTERIADYITSELAVYDYQLYQIYEWLLSLETESSCNSHLISAARNLAFDGDRDFYLRNVTRRYLGEHGSTGDLDNLRQEYSVYSSVCEKVTIISSLKKMVKPERNGFYAEIRSDGWPHAATVDLIKESH